MKIGLMSAIAGAALTMTCAPASAVFMTFFGEDIGNGEVNNNTVPLDPPFVNSDGAMMQFLSFLENPITESFEGYTPAATDPQFPTTIPEDPPQNIDFGPSGTASFDRGAIVRGVDNEGRYASDGEQFLFLLQGEDATTITFSEPQVALGFRGIDVGDFGGQLTTITLIAMDGVSRRVVEVPHSQSSGGEISGSVLFFGIIDTDEPFIAMELRNSEPGTDGFAFDEFTIGNFEVLIPSPLGAAMGFVGLAGLAARRRRTA